VLTRERVDLLADDHTEVLEAHPVDALMDRRDELDVGDDLPAEDLQRRGEDDQRNRSAVPDILVAGGRMTLEEHPHVEVLVPLRDADREVAERVRADVDAALQQPLVLHRGEPPVVADDVADRIVRHVATL
jgi:hypothetical protein